MVLGGAPAVAGPGEDTPSGFLDLSLVVAPDLPCTWPAPNWPLFQINHYSRPGPHGAYASDILTIDGNILKPAEQYAYTVEPIHAALGNPYCSGLSALVRQLALGSLHLAEM